MSKNLLIALDEFKEAEKYWAGKFSGELNEVKLLRDFPETKRYQDGSIKLTLEKPVIEKLLGLSKNNDLSLYVILLSAFKVVLSRYTGQKDIITVSPVYTPANEKYNKYVALRDTVDDGISFKEQLLKVRETVVEGYKNEHYSIDHLADLLDLDEQFSLARVIFMLESIHNTGVILDKPGEQGSDLIVSFSKEPGRLDADVRYNVKLFKKETIRRLLDTYSRVLAQVMGDITIKLNRIAYISEEEKQKILVDFNQTRRDYPGPKTLHERFERQVEKTPGNIALRSTLEVMNIYDELKPEQVDLRMSYEDLNHQANQTAAELREMGVGPDVIVGLLVRHPLEMVVGVFGILKAGGAYVPISHGYSDDVKTRICRDADIRVLVTQEDFADGLPDALAALNVLTVGEAQMSDHDGSNLQHSAGPSNLAYVIYTSGTMGEPKGIQVEHRGVVNYVNWRLETLQCSQDDVTLQPLAYNFDGFVSNFYSTLLSGGVLYIVPPDKRMDPGYIKNVIRDHKITNTSLVPGMYNLLLDGVPEEDLKSFRLVVLAGDKSSAQLVEKSKQKAPHIKLLNEYGPTEVTVTATGHSGIDPANTAVIGAPIANAAVYILDESMTPVPLGAAGELCVAGAGLARGYLNNSLMTAEKFVSLPLTPGSSALTRVYRTGDLARRLPSETGETPLIEFLGRIDQQVKIRGFRVELAAVEHRLSQHDGVRQAVVLAVEPRGRGVDAGGRSLIAFYVPQPGGSLENNEAADAGEILENHLAGHLPDYMVPLRFTALEHIPLTRNGKTDRRALEAMEIDASTEFKAPENDAETLLTEVLRDVLGLDRVGVNDNFFEIGGNSIKAIQSAIRLQKHGVKLDTAHFFLNPVIGDLAGCIEQTAGTVYVPIESAKNQDHYPLSSAQKRIFVAQQMELESTSYNMPNVAVLEGKLDKERLEESFRQLIRRHESFRTSFTIEGMEPVQRVHDTVDFGLEYFEEGGEADIPRRIEAFIRPFNLEHAPLLRVGLVKINEEKHILMVDMAHIVSDGASLALTVMEFMQLYNGEPLPELKIQYKDFAAWRNEPAQAGALQRQEAYWLETFSGDIPVLTLPTDFPRPDVRNIDRGGLVTRALEEELYGKLLDLLTITSTTTYMALLAVWNILLHKYSGARDIVVGSPVTGRTHPDLENIIGVFLNMSAMRNRPEGEKTVAAFLEEVKVNVLQAYDNQDYPYDDLIVKLGLQGAGGRNPLFDTEFAVNIDVPAIEIPGLSLSSYDTGVNFAKYDLYLLAMETPGAVNLFLRYSTELYTEATAQKLLDHFIEILEQVVEDGDTTIEALRISHDVVAAAPTGRDDDDGDFEF